MRRLHLLEIHEQPWCPTAVRNGATDCLAGIAVVLQQYRNVAPLLAEALAASGSRRIVDLCSGGAGPWRSLVPRLQRRLGGEPLRVLLTDLYPSWHCTSEGTSAPAPETPRRRTWACGLNKRGCASSPFHPTTASSRITLSPLQLIFVPFSVDATQVSPSLPGFRTLFTAFHHFSPPVAQAILQSAVNERQGIAIFEQTRRHPLALLVMLALPLLAWLLTPFIRPWRPSRFFWTYVIPVIPAVLCFDGIVSCLRTYTPEELRALAAGLQGPAYRWQAGRVASPLSPIGVTYLIGVPVVK